MKLDLPLDDARLLSAHLHQRILELDSELVRTDQHTLQHSFAQEIDALRRIAARLDAQIDSVGDAAVA